MLQRLLRNVRIVIASVLAATACAAAPTQPEPQRIVAVGDLHGDFAVWRDIAGASGVIDAKGRWTGGRTTLVQVGDMVDRGPDSLKIVRDMMRLQKEAAKAGGKVIVLTGNHEAMNFIGDLRYTTPGEFAAFATRDSAELRDRLYESKKQEIEASFRAKDPSMTPATIRQAWLNQTPLGWVEQRLAWATDGEIGRWVLGNPAVAKVGGTLFVHGGLSAEYSKQPIEAINRRVASALKAMDRSPGSILTDPLGPLWYRGLLTRNPKITEIPSGGLPRPAMSEELTSVLAAYGAQRIVVGHTPVLAGIQTLGGGRLITIDTGNSRYYSGTPSYLEIVGDRVVPHAVKRSVPAEGGQ